MIVTTTFYRKIFFMYLFKLGFSFFWIYAFIFSLLLLDFFFFVFLLFVVCCLLLLLLLLFLGPLPRHMEVPRLGVELEL